MENYFNWLHSAIIASPWSNNLNKKLLTYATENVTAAVGLVQKLSQAKAAMIERPTLPDNSVACSVELREDAAKRLYSPSRLM
jgi:hypothetical protein